MGKIFTIFTTFFVLSAVYFLEFRGYIDIKNKLDLSMAVIVAVSLVVMIYYGFTEAITNKKKKKKTEELLSKAVICVSIFALFLVLLTTGLTKSLLYILPFIFKPNTDVRIYSGILTVILIYYFVLHKSNLWDRLIDYFRKL